METKSYTQCYLSRKGTHRTVWIPSQFAKVGKVLKIKDEDGWRVEETYATFRAEFVEKHKIDFRIALPND